MHLSESYSKQKKFLFPHNKAVKLPMGEGGWGGWRSKEQQLQHRRKREPLVFGSYCKDLTLSKGWRTEATFLVNQKLKIPKRSCFSQEWRTRSNLLEFLLLVPLHPPLLPFLVKSDQTTLWNSHGEEKSHNGEVGTAYPLINPELGRRMRQMCVLALVFLLQLNTVLLPAAQGWFPHLFWRTNCAIWVADDDSISWIPWKYLSNHIT